MKPSNNFTENIASDNFTERSQSTLIFNDVEHWANLMPIVPRYWKEAFECFNELTTTEDLFLENLVYSWQQSSRDFRKYLDKETKIKKYFLSKFIINTKEVPLYRTVYFEVEDYYTNFNVEEFLKGKINLKNEFISTSTNKDFLIDKFGRDRYFKSGCKAISATFRVECKIIFDRVQELRDFGECEVIGYGIESMELVNCYVFETIDFVNRILDTPNYNSLVISCVK